MGKIIKILWFIVYPFYMLVTINSRQGTQTILCTLFDENIENGCYYSDCIKSK